MEPISDIETCNTCDGAFKVIACIEDPVIIEKIQEHCERKDEANEPNPLPEIQAPPTDLRTGMFY